MSDQCHHKSQQRPADDGGNRTDRSPATAECVELPKTVVFTSGKRLKKKHRQPSESESSNVLCVCVCVFDFVCVCVFFTRNGHYVGRFFVAQQICENGEIIACSGLFMRNSTELAQTSQPVQRLKEREREHGI